MMTLAISSKPSSLFRTFLRILVPKILLFLGLWEGLEVSSVSWNSSLFRAKRNTFGLATKVSLNSGQPIQYTYQFIVNPSVSVHNMCKFPQSHIDTYTNDLT